MSLKHVNEWQITCDEPGCSVTSVWEVGHRLDYGEMLIEHGQGRRIAQAYSLDRLFTKLRGRGWKVTADKVLCPEHKQRAKDARKEAKLSKDAGQST